MELLVPAGVTLLTQLYKWLTSKTEYAKEYVLFVAFVLSLLGTAGWKLYEGKLEWTNVEGLISTFGLAVGYYEIIVKRFISPVINKFQN